MTAFKPLLATIGFALAVATTFAEPYNTSRQYGNTPHPVRNAQPVTIDSMKLPPPLPVNALPLDLHSPENPDEKRTDSLVEKSADTIPVASTDQKMPIEGNLVDSKDQKTPVSEMIVGSTEQKMPVEDTPVASTDQKIPIEDTPVSSTDQKIPIEDTPVSSTDQKIPIEDTPVSSTDQKIPIADIIVASIDQKIPIEEILAASTNIVETKWLVGSVFTDNMKEKTFARPSTRAIRRMQDFLKELGYVAIPIVL
jgi:hypothetical protein